MSIQTHLPTRKFNIDELELKSEYSYPTLRMLCIIYYLSKTCLPSHLVTTFLMLCDHSLALCVHILHLHLILPSDHEHLPLHDVHPHHVHLNNLSHLAIIYAITANLKNKLAPNLTHLSLSARHTVINS